MALMTFKVLTEAYLADRKIQRQALYKCKKLWIENRFVPTFGGGTLATAVTSDMVEAYLEGRRKEVALATVNPETSWYKAYLFLGCAEGSDGQEPAPASEVGAGRQCEGRNSRTSTIRYLTAASFQRPASDQSAGVPDSDASR
jgi:hypothetical protein